jgi:hypothetical protein
MSTLTFFPVVKLPYDPLTKLDSVQEPTAEAVHLLRRELSANARMIPTQLAGGRHGHLGLVMPATEYLTLAGEAYHLPEPPDIPDYTAHKSPEERAKWVKRYLVETKQ